MSLIGVWTNEATKALLSIWGGEVVQNQLRELKRNRSVFEKIAEDMSDLGIEFTWKQCRTKVKNLSQFYRKAIKESEGVEEKEPSCPFFKELDYIFNPRENSQPPMFQPVSDTVDGMRSEIHVVNCALPPSPPPPPPPPRLEIQLEHRDSSEQDSNIVATEYDVADIEDRREDQTEGAFSQLGIPASNGVTSDMNPSTSQSGSQRKRRLPDDDFLELISRLENAAEAREDARQRRLLEHEERMEQMREKREDQRRQREQLHEERILSMFLSFLEQLTRHFQGSIQPPGPTSSNSNSNPSFSSSATEPCATATTLIPTTKPSQPLKHAPDVP